MVTWRDRKRAARRTVHQHMQHRALYLASVPLDSMSDPPVEITVRIHTKFSALGDQPGTSYQFAQRFEEVPKLRLLRAEVNPERLGVISVSEGEAYQIENVLPPDDEFVTVEVFRLSAVKAAGLPVPAVTE